MLWIGDNLIVGMTEWLLLRYVHLAKYLTSWHGQRKKSVCVCEKERETIRGEERKRERSKNKAFSIFWPSWRSGYISSFFIIQTTPTSSYNAAFLSGDKLRLITDGKHKSFQLIRVWHQISSATLYRHTWCGTPLLLLLPFHICRHRHATSGSTQLIFTQ